VVRIDAESFQEVNSTPFTGFGRWFDQQGLLNNTLCFSHADCWRFAKQALISGNDRSLHPRQELETLHSLLATTL
jgi:hypothetical protein